MQLVELQLTRDLKNLSKVAARNTTGIGTALAEIVAQHGWTLLGRGSEAAVAENPHKSYVLKIYPTRSLYRHFVKLALQNQNNPHFPKFSRRQRVVPGTVFSYVRMEKLIRVTSFDLKIDMPESFCVAKKLYSTIGGTLPDWIKNDSSQIDCSIISPQAAQVVSGMTAQLKKIGPNLDLQPHNFMRRGAVWVITDPYY